RGYPLDAGVVRVGPPSAASHRWRALDGVGRPAGLPDHALEQHEPGPRVLRRPIVGLDVRPVRRWLRRGVRRIAGPLRDEQPVPHGSHQPATPGVAGSSDRLLCDAGWADLPHRLALRIARRVKVESPNHLLRTRYVEERGASIDRSTDGF